MILNSEQLQVLGDFEKISHLLRGLLQSAPPNQFNSGRTEAFFSGLNAAFEKQRRRRIWQIDDVLGAIQGSKRSIGR
ncbi:hypothetical protein DN536_32355 [Burkholderia multivorans]|nr:hypothetical protein DN536_32355 [Burkholderia multivorans]